MSSRILPAFLEQPESPVAPGNLTGVYYIIVAGLPFKCSWQDLKDFARNGRGDGPCIDIDHAMIYPSSTDGWVRVKGKRNFLRALDRLDGGILGDRALLADGRNEKQWTNLKDMKPSSGSPSKPRRESTTTVSPPGSPYSQNGRCLLTAVYSGHEPYSESNYCLSSVGSSSTYTPASPLSTASYTRTSPYTLPPQKLIHPRAIYAGRLLPSTPGFAAPVPLMAYMVPLPSPDTKSTPRVPHHSPPVPVVRSEARKIIITKLSHTVDKEALEALLRGVLTCHGAPSSEDVKIELAYNKTGDRKDHAFAVFGDAVSASRTIKSLNGYKFHGRRIQVRLTREPIRTERMHHEIDHDPTPAAPPPSPASHVSSPASKTVSTKPAVSSRHLGSSIVSRMAGLELASRTSTPLVVDGSSRPSRRGSSISSSQSVS